MKLSTHWHEAAKRTMDWTLPPAIQDVLRTHISSMVQNRGDNRATISKNESLRNAHRGQRCFILATGPSIKRQDLRLLEGENCIAVSNFFVHPDFARIKPRYYCLAPYHPPITEEAWASWLAELETGTEDATMFFGLADRERNQRNGRFLNRSVHYLNFRDGDVRFTGDVDLTRSLPGPQSVTIMALMLAIYMGFKKIYLLGCDHDWILHLNTSGHFYDEREHALNRKGYSEWFTTDFESHCHDYVRLWQQYKALKCIASTKSISIYNATNGGLLDVFPRISYLTLFPFNNETV